MWTWIGLVLGALVAVATILWVGLVVSLRTKFPPALAAIRRLNRALWNRQAMKKAGSPGAYASVIHHVGRVSGRPYRTPVGVVGTGEGFAIALPYGTGPDWLKNVMAAGWAVIDTEGSTFAVGEPEVVPASRVDRFFPAKERRAHRLYGVDQFLLLRSRSGATTTGRGPAGR